MGREIVIDPAELFKAVDNVDEDLPEKFSFIVIGRPQAKQRARVYFDERSQSARSYTPKRTADYETKIAHAYRCAGGKYYGKSRLAVRILAYFSFPKSYSQKKVRELCESGVSPTSKPDCDNIIKSVLDGLNKVAYYDDSWVVDVSCKKQYAPPGNEAYIRIEIEMFG